MGITVMIELCQYISTINIEFYKKLQRLAYLPDIALSDYHLFQSM